MRTLVLKIFSLSTLLCCQSGNGGCCVINRGFGNRLFILNTKVVVIWEGIGAARGILRGGECGGIVRRVEMV